MDSATCRLVHRAVATDRCTVLSLVHHPSVLGGSKPTAGQESDDSTEAASTSRWGHGAHINQCNATAPLQAPSGTNHMCACMMQHFSAGWTWHARRRPSARPTSVPAPDDHHGFGSRLRLQIVVQWVVCLGQAHHGRDGKAQPHEEAAQLQAGAQPAGVAQALHAQHGGREGRQRKVMER